MTVSELYELYVHNPVITTDSRNCPGGSIFFALKGEHFDGNKYAEQALNSGCVYAVIDNPDYYKGERTILAGNVLDALQQLACLHRKTIGIPVIAITGTNGKTTTKELIASVLSTKFNLLYTEGNLNNHIGVPLTLLKMNHNHEMAVIEMGANHPGEIKQLAQIAQPDYGIITNAGYAHLEGFGSFANVLKTKAELYDYIRNTHGRIFIRQEDENLQSQAKGIEQITYGGRDGSFVSGQAAGSDSYFVFNWKQQGKAYTVKTQLVGDYNIDNVLAAVAVGRYFKIPPGHINRAIAAYTPSNNRSQLKQAKNNRLVIDAYNANPSSMKASLDNFLRLDAPRKAVILGDMMELGEESGRFHQEVTSRLQHDGFDKVFLCGEHFSEAGKGYNTYADTCKLIESLKKENLQGYTILIKGSRYMQLERVIDLL